MTVKEANKYIEAIDNEVKNLQKLLKADVKEYLEDTCNIDVVSMVNIGVNSMVAYKNVLRDRINNTEIEM